MGLIKAPYRDAFISYARDDNTLWDDSVDEFRSALKRKFEAEMRNRFDLPGDLSADFFLDRHGLPANGDLTSELQKAVSSSVFLVILIGASYPRSLWCGKELKMFAEATGMDRKAALDRTFLVVLERSALSSNWGEHLESPERPIFEPFFDDVTGRAIPMMLENNEGRACHSPRFSARLRRIVETMADRAAPLLNAGALHG